MEVKNMDNDAYSIALNNALNEIQKVCPDIQSSFMFREDGQIVAGDESTPRKTMTCVTEAFDGILDKAEAIGGLEGITLEAGKGRVNVSCIDNIYLVTVTSKKADMNFVNTVTRVLVPTVLKLLEKISPASLKNTTALPESPIVEEKPEKTTEELAEEPVSGETEETSELDPMLPEPPVNQLIVGRLGGILVPSDTARIDSETLTQWEDLYNGKKVEEVEVETFDGKTTQCKIKPIKDSKYEGKGIIRMPDKIQLKLEIKKGELVRVKPIVD
jgi:hypothetical protein